MSGKGKWPFETLNRDDLGQEIEEEEVLMDADLEKELSVLAACMQPEVSKKKRKERWERLLREQDSDNDMAIIDDRDGLREPESAPLPLPVLSQITPEKQAFEAWLCETTMEELLAKPSLVSLTYQESQKCSALAMRLERFLKQRFREKTITENLRQENLKLTQTSLTRKDAVFYKYESPSWEVIFLVVDGKNTNYWIQKR